MSYRSDSKLFNELASFRVKCKCGHSVILTNLTDKKICGWCGHWVYRNKGIEFKEQLKKRGVKIGAR